MPSWSVGRPPGETGRCRAADLGDQDELHSPGIVAQSLDGLVSEQFLGALGDEELRVLARFVDGVALVRTWRDGDSERASIGCHDQPHTGARRHAGLRDDVSYS